MTCVRRNLNNRACCNSWQKGIRTIDGQYPDDNREFEIRAGAGINITPITAGILITNSADVASSFTEGSNIEFTTSGDQVVIGVVDGPTFADDTTINADLIVNGDIIQRGAAYETHAEHIYTADDYIIMRDGALAGLGSGDYSGFQVKLYDGVNDGRLVIDNTGTARVGDVGDEQPLLTRDESADLTDGDSLIWNSANSKAVTTAIPSAISTALAGKQDTITVTRPANRVHTGIGISISQSSYTKYGKLIIFGIEFTTTATISTGSVLLTFDDKPVIDEWMPISSATNDKNYSSRIDTSGNLIATESFSSGEYCIIRGVYYTNS